MTLSTSVHTRVTPLRRIPSVCGAFMVAVTRPCPRFPALPQMVRNAMKKGLPGDRLRLVDWELSRGGPSSMLYAGLDLSRKRLDFHLLDE